MSERPSLAVLLAASAAALALPPFLLVPLVFHLPRAQLFKDFYEACLWLTPAVGIAVLAQAFRLWRRQIATWRQPALIMVLLLGALDLAAPLFFYILLAVLGGH